jgi:DNA invertase Pin-like site-specific DNA recombinase
MAERPRRCAIYTRKSSDEGLDQAYNSLDAQRDACAAYITSQKHEGWIPLETHYDDGGFSGGSLERPALQALLADIANGAIDIIVVYKIDRLTRSLADFAKLTETLDKHGVSFVAVTQQFNTSTSMGRLTLNVLLSFAQFEREVAGERIRDKIAASKRRGMWMGGRPPIGYDVKDRKLIVNETEAETVRYIYRRYLELRSLNRLQTDLRDSGIRSKVHIGTDGQPFGGCVIGRGALGYILTGQVYRGMVLFKGELYPGEHPRIVPEDLFQDVQTALSAQGPGKAARAKRPSTSLLKGLVFDEAGVPLQVSHTNKKGRKYRYYVSATKMRGPTQAGDGFRIPASDLEKIVVQSLARHLRDLPWLDQTFKGHVDVTKFQRLTSLAGNLANMIEEELAQSSGLIPTIIDRIVVAKKTIEINVGPARLLSLLLGQASDAEQSQPPIEIKVFGQFIRCGKEVRLVIGQEDAKDAKVDSRLVREIVQARQWFDDLANWRVASIADLARISGVSAPYISKKISLAFLAPDITEMIVTGTQPMRLTPEALKRACPLPVSWDEQRTLLIS